MNLNLVLRLLLLDNKEDIVILAYAAAAEARSLLSLGIDPLQFKWVDLYAEFRMLCNSNYSIAYGNYLDETSKVRYSTPPPYPALTEEQKKLDRDDHSETPYNLVNAVYKCLDVILDSELKEEMRNLILSKDLVKIHASIDEIMDYCESDTKYLRALDISISSLLAKQGIIDIREDQYERGRYSVATAMCEQLGIPIDMDLLNKIIEKTPDILDVSKQQVNKYFPFFVPEYQRPPKTLKNGKVFTYVPEPAKKDMNAYQEYVASLNIPNFPKTETKKFKCDRDTLEEFGYWGGLEELWKYNKTEQSLKWFNPKGTRADDIFLPNLTSSSKILGNIKGNGNGFFDRLGSDNAVRPYYGIFGTQTGRNAAKAKTFPLAMSSWLRAIIKPPKDEVIISCDFSQQEVYVAAILSGDSNLLDAYKSGDVYLEFAFMAGLAIRQGKSFYEALIDGVNVKTIKEAQKKVHKDERNLCKSTVLGLQYGMGKAKLNTKLRLDTGEDVSMEKTEELISAHKTTFSTFWKWVYEISERYKDRVPLITTDGWILFCDNPVMTSVRNFLVQANSASITRIAIVKLVEQNVKVMCGLHDAIYVRGLAINRDSLIKDIEREMLEATKVILSEQETFMRIDTKVINHDDLWVEEKGEKDMKALAPLLGLSYT